MKTTSSQNNQSASELITNQIAELGDWRGKRLAQLRKLIAKTAPDLIEEWKWGTAVWSHQGNVVAVAAFQDHIKINFFKGAQIDDPKHLFNAGLDAKATRAIDLFEADKIDDAALKNLLRAAVTLNSKPKPSKK